MIQLLADLPPLGPLRLFRPVNEAILAFVLTSVVLLGVFVVRRVRRKSAPVAKR